jgi:type I restriction enzyme, S subunit
MITVRRPGADWREMSLGAVVSETGGAIQTGPFGSQLHARDYVAVGTPLVMPVNLGDNTINERGIARVGPGDVRRLIRHTLRKGDIVFGRRGDVGRRSIVRAHETGWLCGTGCLAARFGHNLECVNADFVALYLGLSKVRTWLEDNAVGGTMPNLNTSILAETPIRMPSRQDQEAIVIALGDIGNVIITLDRLIAKKQAIKQGIMQQLLTGKTRLPSFTLPWAEYRLGDHVTYVKTVALSRAQLDSVSPMRYLHYGDIHTSTDVVLGAAEKPMPRASSALVGCAGRLQVGDVIFADASEDLAGVGKSVEIISVPNEGVVPGLHTIAARFNKSVLADGFKAYLQFIPEFHNVLVRLAAGTKVLATTRSYISGIALKLPAVDEQLAIAQALRDSDDEIRTSRDLLTKARAVKQGMMQELLTGHTRLPVEKGAA